MPDRNGNPTWEEMIRAGNTPLNYWIPANIPPRNITADTTTPATPLESPPDDYEEDDSESDDEYDSDESDESDESDDDYDNESDDERSTPPLNITPSGETVMEMQFTRRDNIRSIIMAFQFTRRRDDDGNERVRVIAGNVYRHLDPAHGYERPTPRMNVTPQQLIQDVLAVCGPSTPVPSRMDVRGTAETIANILDDSDGGSCGWAFSNRGQVTERVARSEPCTVARVAGMEALRDYIPVHPCEIHGHSYKPRVHHVTMARDSEGKSDTHPTLFGVELEIDNSPDTVRQAIPYHVPALVSPLFYCKHDGSLRNGVEMVSHPMSEAFWRDKAPVVNAVLAQLSGLRWHADKIKTAGMHIHISRSAFRGHMHLYRFLHLVYRSPQLTIEISQRAPNALDQWATLNLRERKGLKVKVGLLPHEDEQWRYEAVNMTPKTAEMRIFRATLLPEIFWKNMEYVFAALAFTRETERLRGCNAKGFAAYVARRHAKYSNLLAFMRQHTTVGQGL